MQTIGYSKNKDTKRMLANLIDHGREVMEMILLCKDHKIWDGNGPVPTRPVVSGNKGLNTHLSELLSEILEPVSFSIGGGEIASTEEALSRIEHINNTVLKHEDLSALNAFEEVLQTDNISQILREECGSINEKLIGDCTYLDETNSLNVSGDSEVSVLSLDSEEEQVLETLSELEKEAIASRETIALKKDESVATVPEKKKRVKITDFFPGGG